MHLINWEEIIKPLTHGGLGIQTSELKNKSMLGGLVWRLLTIREPWSDILAKHLIAHVNSFHNRTPCNWRDFYEGFKTLNRGMGWAIDNGNNISLWNDVCVFNQPLWD